MLYQGKRFQFPSNGKAYPKDQKAVNAQETANVSIPFKRESVSQGNATKLNKEEGPKVSIPFKRESVSQERFARDVAGPHMFQFPSNGKAYPKEKVFVASTVHTHLFQFPSNGKAYPKRVIAGG